MADVTSIYGKISSEQLRKVEKVKPFGFPRPWEIDPSVYLYMTYQVPEKKSSLKDKTRMRFI